MKKLLLLIMFLIGMNLTVLASNVWEQKTPIDAKAYCITNDGTNLYLGTYGYGLYSSTDNGTNWIAKNSGLTQTYSLYVSALTVDGTNLYAGTYSGVYVSTDAGGTWTSISNGISVQGGYITISQILVKGTYLYAATNSGVYVSSNSGTTWTLSNSGLSGTQKNITSLAFYNDTLFLGYSKGIYKSTDNGQNWVIASSSSTVTYVYSLMVKDSIIYAGTYGNGIYISSDAGATWVARSTGISTSAVANYFYSLSSIGTNIFALSYNEGLYYSSNYGVNWELRKNGLGITNLRNISPLNTDLYISSYGGGVYYSSNIGATWTVRNDNNINTLSATVINSSGTNLYVGGVTTNLFTSSDSGENWSSLFHNNISNVTNLNAYYVYSILVNGNKIYAGTNQYGLLLSTDNGNTWTEKTSSTFSNEYIFCLAQKDSFLIAGTYQHGILFSTNDGDSWEKRNTGLNSTYIRSLLVNNNIIYASSIGAGVYYSTNDGSTWTNCTDGLTSLSARKLAYKDSNLYVITTDSGVFRANINTLTWTAINTGITDKSIYSISVKDSIIFIGTRTGIVYYSTNNGGNWKDISTGLPSAYIYSLANLGSNLFACTSTKGVYKADIAALFAMPSPLKISTISSVTMNQDTIANTTFSVYGDSLKACSFTIKAANTALFPANNSFAISGSDTVRTLAISPAAGLYGTSSVTITAYDATESVYTVFKITVKDTSTVVKTPLAISTISNVTMNQDTTLTVPFKITGDSLNIVQFSITSNNAKLFPQNSMVISGSDSNRKITLTPTSGTFGTARITIVALTSTDTVTTSFRVTVNDTSSTVNVIKISSVPNVTMVENSSTFTHFTVSAKDVSLVTLSLTSSNTGLLPVSSLAITGTQSSTFALDTLTITPIANTYGIAFVTIKASDGTYTTSTSFMVTVQDTTTQTTTKPEISAIGDVIMNQDTSVSVTFTVNGKDPYSLLFIKTSSNTGLFPLYSLAVTGSGKTRYLTITPVTGMHGSSNVKISVTDGTDTASASFKITVLEVTSVKEDLDLNNKLITLYPTPTNNKIYLKLNSNDLNIENIEFLDLKGNLIFESSSINLLSNNNLLEFDVSKYTSGVYICRILTRNSIITKKFVIE